MGARKNIPTLEVDEAMQLEVKDILGISTVMVEIPKGGAVEVCGPNAAGKTSIALAAQAVLAQEANPLGVPAPQARRVYVHDGAEYGQAVLSEDGLIVTWRPSAGTIEAPIGQPHSTPEAAGLIDFTARTGAKQRAEQLQAALLPRPDDVMNALQAELANYVSSDDLLGVLAMVSERGFDAAASVYSERAREAKRRWSAITGATWGVKVAADWLPTGWLADYDALTPQSAEERVVAARDALAALHQVKAVSDAEIAESEAARAKIAPLEKEVKKERAKVQSLVEARDLVDVDSAEREVTRLSREISQSSVPHPCPHCGGQLLIAGSVIVAYDSESKAAQEQLIAQLDNARATRTELQDRRWEKQREVDAATLIARRAEDLLTAAKAAAVRGEGVRVGDEHGAAIASAEADVESARDVVNTVKAAQEATQIHATILRYAEIARAIGPQGVRQRMLTAGLAKLNAGLHALSEETGWPAMLADEKGGLSWNGRPVQLCSESERWRAQAAMQLTLGAISDARAVVLDRADLLDPEQRVALAAAISRATGKGRAIGVLLCATENSYTGKRPWPVVKIQEGKIQ